MIKDNTLDEAMVEAARFLKAAKALRAARKGKTKRCWRSACELYQQVQPLERHKCPECGETLYEHGSESIPHAACKRASLDLTRKLADLRAGR